VPAERTVPNVIGFQPRTVMIVLNYGRNQLVAVNQEAGA